MIDINLIDDPTLNAILSNLGFEDLTPEQEAWIANSTPEELMDKFLNWEGMIGYTSMIIKAWKSINAAVVDNPMERLIRYCWDDEYTSYQEENRLGDEDDIIQHALNNKNQDHIFCALAKLHMEG